MKSRLVILATLVVGMLMSTAGAGLAVSGFAANNDASVAVYGGSNNNVLGEQEQGEDRQDVLPEESSGGNAPSNDNGGGGVQPSRQVEAGATTGSQLPFTGFAAIPILLIGIAMLTAGLVLRRKQTDA